MADRKAANRLSAQISRDEKRQRLGEEEFNRQRAEVMRKHRKKQREEAEMAQAQAELQAEAAPQAQAQAQAQAQNFWAFLHLLGAFGASFCAEMVKTPKIFTPAAGRGAFADS